MIEITLVGFEGREEVDASFDEATHECVEINIHVASIIPEMYKEWCDEHGDDEDKVAWTPGTNPLYHHPDKPTLILVFLRKKGFQTNAEEEEWMDKNEANATWSNPGYSGIRWHHGRLSLKPPAS